MSAQARRSLNLLPCGPPLEQRFNATTRDPNLDRSADIDRGGFILRTLGNRSVLVGAATGARWRTGARLGLLVIPMLVPAMVE
jgi:hypothetical protein